MIRRKIAAALGAAFVAVATAAVIATVTFDPVTGTGFVGKGDVQTAFGWNNAGAQQHAYELSFGGREHVTRYKDCLENGNPNNDPIRLIDERWQARDIAATVSYDARKHQQVDGFILTGYVGEPHVVGGSMTQQFCPAGYHPANGDEETGWSDWVVDEAGTALYVTWNGTSVQIWP